MYVVNERRTVIFTRRVKYISYCFRLLLLFTKQTIFFDDGCLRSQVMRTRTEEHWLSGRSVNRMSIRIIDLQTMGKQIECKKAAIHPKKKLKKLLPEGRNCHGYSVYLWILMRVNDSAYSIIVSRYFRCSVQRTYLISGILWIRTTSMTFNKLITPNDRHSTVSYIIILLLLLFKI